jgi:hypothetical protein
VFTAALTKGFPTSVSNGPIHERQCARFPEAGVDGREAGHGLDEAVGVARAAGRHPDQARGPGRMLGDNITKSV